MDELRQQMEDKEQVCDELIQPLITQLRAICLEHGMPYAVIVQFGGNIMEAGFAASTCNHLDRHPFCCVEIREIAQILDDAKNNASPEQIHDYAA